MSAHGFRSVFMVASCAGAALGCYLVSLRVASERAALENVETKIVLAQRDLRLLQTEIGTRGRLAQLERWNVKVLALSAPSADQFLNGGFELAKLTVPQRRIDLEAPVVLASASTDTPPPRIEGAPQPENEAARQDPSPQQILHMASLNRNVGSDTQRAVVSLKPAAPKDGSKRIQDQALGATKPVASAKPKPKPASAPAKPAGIATKAVAESDPLAPIATPAKSKSVASATSKDAARKQ